MSYILKTNPCNPHNCGGYRDPNNVPFLVWHYTANDGDSDEGNANYFHNNILKSPASANAFIDDDSVTISVPSNQIAYAVGGSKWDDCGQTGGGKYYGLVSNRNSFSIELCDTVHNGKHDISPKTRENALLFGASMILELGIQPDHIIRHFDVNGKHCPGFDGWWGKNDAEWRKFKEDLLVLTGKNIHELLMKYYDSQSIPTTWNAKKELDEAVALGITSGANAMRPATRLETAIMIKRYAKNNN